jgi:hypothetical protein
MRHIAGADDEIELEREALRKLVVIIDRHNVEGTEPLEVLDVVRGRSRAIDLISHDVRKESCVAACRYSALVCSLHRQVHDRKVTYSTFNIENAKLLAWAGAIPGEQTENGEAGMEDDWCPWIAS